jgi:hypothetical protein
MDNHLTPRTPEEFQAAIARHKIKNIHSNSPPLGARRNLSPGCAAPFFALVILIGLVSIMVIHDLAAKDRDRLIITGTARAETVEDEPETDIPPLPTWEASAQYRGVGDDHIDAIRAAYESKGVAGAFLLAIGELESHNQHHTPGGSVKRGDGGRAIGWGQVHRSPWQKWAADGLEREVDLDDLEDNVLVAAMILLRGGYDPDDPETYGPAAAYYNTGKHLDSTSYSRRALRVLAEIEDGE